MRLACVATTTRTRRLLYYNVRLVGYVWWSRRDQATNPNSGTTHPSRPVFNRGGGLARAPPPVFLWGLGPVWARTARPLLGAAGLLVAIECASRRRGSLRRRLTVLMALAVPLRSASGSIARHLTRPIHPLHPHRQAAGGRGPWGVVHWSGFVGGSIPSLASSRSRSRSTKGARRLPLATMDGLSGGSMIPPMPSAASALNANGGDGAMVRALGGWVIEWSCRRISR